MQYIDKEQVAELIRARFVELPDLHVTFWQAQRLWNLPDDLCDGALSALVRSRFLERTPDGRYRRNTRYNRSWRLLVSSRREVG
jgi:hypothetical protein